MERAMFHPGRLAVFATVLAVALLAAVAVPAPAADPSDQQRLVDSARRTFQHFVNDPDMGWFRNHLKDSKGLLIFPQVWRAAFIFGLEGGNGVLVARNEKTGKWSDPAFYTMGSGSFGLQVGVQAAEVVLMVRSASGMDSMLGSSFKLGVDASVAAGPVGAGVKAKTSDILAFARAKGVFIGISVDGAVIATRDKWNSAYYDKPGVRPLNILVTRDVRNKKAAPLVQTVTKAAK